MDIVYLCTYVCMYVRMYDVFDSVVYHTDTNLLSLFRPEKHVAAAYIYMYGYGYGGYGYVPMYISQNYTRVVWLAVVGSVKPLLLQ